MAQVGGALKGLGKWIAALALLAALPTSSASAAAWRPAEEISEASVEVLGPQLGVDDSGDVTAAWVRVGTYPSGSIKSAYLPAGGTWQAIQTPISTTTCEKPSLAVGSGGAAVLVADCGAGKMKVAFRPSASGAWGSAVELPGSENSVDPRAAIDDAGNAIVVWDHAEKIESSYRPVSTGVWGAAQAISGAGVGAEPEARVAMSPLGTAVAVWRNEETASIVVVDGMMRAAGAASIWGSFRKLSPATGFASWPDLAVDGESLGVVWAQKATSPSEHFVLKNAWGNCDPCSWGEDAAAHEAGATDRSVEEPGLALYGAGHMIATWRALDIPTVFGTGEPQSAATSFINGAWSTPATLTTPESTRLSVFADGPTPAADEAGDASVIFTGVDSKLYAATSAPGEAFGGAVEISNANEVEYDNSLGRHPTPLAMDPGGDAFAAWTGEEGGRRMTFAMRDGSPPTLSGVVVPVSGSTGTALSMSATASDVWSPPTTIHWDFGDGASGSGNSVSHAYAAPGTYTVSVTASDAQGNLSAAQTRQIAIAGGGGETKKPAVVVRISVAKQTWKAIAKARAIKVRCGLDVSGTCAVAATLGAGTAKELGLRAKGGKPVSIGRGSLAVSGNGSATVKVKLTKKALKAIGAATRSVGVALTATGSAPGHRDGSQTRKLKIKRP